jgi:hypothetical protein
MQQRFSSGQGPEKGALEELLELSPAQEVGEFGYARGDSPCEFVSARAGK